MTTNEMKDILASKLQSEGTYFKKSHIKITTRPHGYQVVIKDYEHCPFNIRLEEDEYFGYCVWVKDEWSDEYIIFEDSKKEYKLFEALQQLGYYIGTRF